MRLAMLTMHLDHVAGKYSATTAVLVVWYMPAIGDSLPDFPRRFMVERGPIAAYKNHHGGSLMKLGLIVICMHG